uniref:Voltage-gated hydrogen channel 1 n=1 Tax=Odontella aurita TaxID=265563 RepID=A0A7S4IEM6_9STRA|mmetsp:Transcript_24017/g.70867  ORF Transcript_24017/g.70867 Transcript_24017/m.70867 type:complete len:367 (+) Transcript_24017:125-1225(+)|eukprot:CAMPEP_0113546062 /NCGR_PEP_ID=MMETSP0015_2-20120614/11603_1 /TAXON_ID=2838 /ORGANISM="Odontella" /LENGTH=366 /DNA_ID=CAMNT_0000446487 /DNA_START=69 /DNA_END=1169 /DNA_ORIENTATION=+ /assembly_acc=CAM_ASM_000160
MAPQEETFVDNEHVMEKAERPAYHIPLDEEEEAHVKELHGEHDWRAKVLHVLHAKPITYTLLGLLLLDVIILFAELYIAAEFPECKLVIRDGISCCPADGAGAAAAHDDGHRRWLKEMDEILAPNDVASKWDSVGSSGNDWRLALGETEDAKKYELFRRTAEDVDEDGDDHGDDHDDHGDDHGAEMTASANGAHDDHGHHSYCTNGLVDMDTAEYPAACDEHKHHAVHTAHTALFWMTVIILCTFLLELSIMIVCLGGAFFTKPFYVLDLFVVSLSLAFELTFKYVDQSQLASIAGLLILARLWRFARIGHGLVESTNKWQAQKQARLMKYVDELETLCKDNGVTLPDRQSIRDLKLLNDEEQEKH